MSSPELPGLVRLVRETEGTASLTLTRSERRNAISPQLADELVSALATIEEWGVLVATLEAEGPAFCAGADLSDLKAGGEAMDRVVEALTAAPIHWTAVVDGAVRGAGLAIIGACPRVLSSPDSTYGLPELAKGFFPRSLIASQSRVASPRRAFELAFSAAPIGAAEAEQHGLVTAVVPADELRSRARASAAALAQADSGALREGIAMWHAQVKGDASFAGAG